MPQPDIRVMLFLGPLDGAAVMVPLFDADDPPMLVTFRRPHGHDLVTYRLTLDYPVAADGIAYVWTGEGHDET